jgi:hypothetical protein
MNLGWPGLGISELGPRSLVISRRNTAKTCGPKTVLSCFSVQDGYEKYFRLALDEITKLPMPVEKKAISRTTR